MPGDGKHMTDTRILLHKMESLAKEILIYC